MIEYTSSKIKDIILDIESKAPVAQWKIKDIYIWPKIRCSLRPFLLNQINKKNTASKNRFALFFWLKNITLHIVSLFKLPFSLRKTDFVFFANGISKICQNNVWSDIIFQPIFDEISQSNKRFFVIENQKIILSGNQYICNIYFLERLCYYIARLKFFFLKEEQVFLPRFDILHNILKDHNLHNKITHKDIVLYGLQIYMLKCMFKFILGFLKPKISFICSYYHNAGYAYNQACKELEIETVEIQHGSQYSHDAYNYWTCLPEGGFGLLPRFFWVWSHVDYSNIKQWSENHAFFHAPYLGGNIGQKSFKTKNESTSLSPSSTKRILVTLQPLKKFSQYWDNLAWVIRKTAKKDVFWTLRHHPTSKGKDLYDGLDEILSIKQSNVTTVHAFEGCLYETLSQTDLHITVISSTGFEAREFNVPTLYISDDARVEQKHLFDLGYGEIIEEKKLILERVLKKEEAIFSGSFKNQTPSIKDSLIYLCSSAKKR